MKQTTKSWVLAEGTVTYTPGEAFEWADEDSSLLLRVYDASAPDLLALCVTDEANFALAVLPRELMALILQAMVRFIRTLPPTERADS